MLVAVVDDDHDLPDLLRAGLERAGHTVALVRDMARPAALLRRLAPDSVLLSVWTHPPEQGWDRLAEITADAVLSTIPVVVYSCDGRDLEAHAAQIRRTHRRSLLAPFTLADLYAALPPQVPSQPAHPAIPRARATAASGSPVSILTARRAPRRPTPATGSGGSPMPATGGWP